MPNLRLTGAMILRDGAMQQRSIAFAEGRITRAPLPEVDLTGYLILPGIVDLHGDAFERHIAPRPSAPFALDTALRATERDAAANGVTTAWLAQGWSWEGGARSPDFAIRLATALRDYTSRHVGTDLRLQIRCETNTVEAEALLIDTVRRFGIDYVVFNNHLDEAELMLETRPEEFHAWARRLGRSRDEHRTALRTAQAQRREVPRFLCRVAEQFDALGISYGSHDDPDGETRETYSMIGAKICEFPTARPAAALARAVGDPILMGAPNVVRGGSQAGNISANALIRAGLCDALVSDYYYPALAQAAFRLADEGVLPFAAAWQMISTRPSQILRLHDRGRLDAGLRADMVIVNATTRAIEATICNGTFTHLSGEAAHRFTSPHHGVALAAE